MEKIEMKILGKYHDFYGQSKTLLLANVFERVRSKRIEIYELDPAHLLSAPRLASQAFLKKTIVKLELLTDTDSSLMVEKGIREEKCHTIHRNAT